MEGYGKQKKEVGMKEKGIKKGKKKGTQRRAEKGKTEKKEGE